jgi:plasmid maintenance system antidote protein VapI
MSGDQGFQPDWVSAPGETISDILRARDLSVAEFARQIGHPLEAAVDILHGRATITLAVARLLERALGGSVGFWLSRDYRYREASARLHSADNDWMAELPLGDMVRFGWLKPTPRPSDELDACLRFFNVPTVWAWREAYAGIRDMAAFRTSPSFESRPAAVAAWLRQGEIEAEAVDCEPWSAERFREALPQLRLLSRQKDPNRFLPVLREQCAKTGVAVAAVRAPAGCRASGATRFLSSDKALLQLSFRYLTDDHFWFSFFHEAAHLLLHGRDGLFVEMAGTPSSPAEQEANEFAARVLVPVEFEDALLALRADGRAVIRFARRLGVSPGVVVGQLQHRGRIRRNQLNGLKRRFTSVV